MLPTQQQQQQQTNKQKTPFQKAMKKGVGVTLLYLVSAAAYFSAWCATIEGCHLLRS
jgi:hypothetical protein